MKASLFYLPTLGSRAEIEKGMAEKSQEFADHGNRVYLPLST